MESAASPRTVRFPPFELDTHSGELREGAKRVRLQDQPFQILRLMLERPGDVVTRDELRQRLWPEGTFVDFEHGLNAAIKRLRVALGDAATEPRFVETVPRRGYRFIGRVDGAPEGRGTAQSSAGVEAVAPAPAVRGLPRLAVLPFANLSDDPAQDYFSDGLTEELIAQLGTMGRGRLGIIGRWSSMTFKGTTARAHAIAETLRADYLLEGSVRRDERAVRITVRLVEAASETQLWSQSYERAAAEFSDSAAGRVSVQIDVAARVAEALTLELVPEVTGSPSAILGADLYQSYLKGRYNWNNGGEDGLDAALAHFEEVVYDAPRFAPGYAALSRARTASSEYYRGVPRFELERAHAAAVRALELDPALAEAHLAMGDARRLLKWDWPGAEADFQRATTLNPSAEAAHRSYGAMLAVLGRTDDAIRAAERACELDPLCMISSLNLAWILYSGRDNAGAIARCRHAVEIEPDRAAAHRLLGAAYLEGGREQEALTAFTDAREVNAGDPVTLTWFAHARAVTGDATAATALMDEARSLGRYLSPYNLALAYSGLGRLDAAFAALDEARLDRDPMVPQVAVDPRFKTVRLDVRYQALASALNVSRREADALRRGAASR